MNAANFWLIFGRFEHAQRDGGESGGCEEEPRADCADTGQYESQATEIRCDRREEQMAAERLQSEKYRHPFRTESPHERHKKAPADQREIALLEPVRKRRAHFA